MFIALFIYLILVIYLTDVILTHKVWIFFKLKLDINCDFSSNNNIWAWFYEFLWLSFWILLGYFHYDRLIGISRTSFLAAILNWNFRLQTLNFRSPHWAYALLNRYIFVFQMESHSVCPVHTSTCVSVDLMLYHYPRRQPNKKKHWFNVLCLYRIATVILIKAFQRFQPSIPNTQY